MFIKSWAVLVQNFLTLEMFVYNNSKQGWTAFNPNKRRGKIFIYEPWCLCRLSRNKNRSSAIIPLVWQPGRKFTAPAFMKINRESNGGVILKEIESGGPGGPGRDLSPGAKERIQFIELLFFFHKPKPPPSTEHLPCQPQASPPFHRPSHQQNSFCWLVEKSVFNFITVLADY